MLVSQSVINLNVSQSQRVTIVSQTEQMFVGSLIEVETPLPYRKAMLKNKLKLNLSHKFHLIFWQNKKNC